MSRLFDDREEFDPIDPIEKADTDAYMKYLDDLERTGSATPPPSGDLVERLTKYRDHMLNHKEPTVYFDISGPSNTDLLATIQDCLTALQGVTISEEDALAVIVLLKAMHKEKLPTGHTLNTMAMRHRIEQALEHSNGR